MFEPPDGLLKTIGFQGVSLEVASSFSEALLADMVLAVLKVFFKEIYSNQQFPGGNFLGLLDFAVHELLNNALEHGNRDDPEKQIMTGLWLGVSGVLLGIHDEGEFFKQESTKKLVEARLPVPSTKKEPPMGGGGEGLLTIYSIADHIFVDTKNGILYLAFLYSSLTAYGVMRI